jgi:hypothetical protein
MSSSILSHAREPNKAAERRRRESSSLRERAASLGHMSTPEDFARLIPELQAWNDGKGIDAESWIRCIGRFDHAVGYAQLFWPEFTIHDDCIMFTDFTVESYQKWMNHTSGHRGQVEAVMNHRHILDLFSRDESDVPRELVLHLGRMLRDMWECKLKRDFPGREIVVSFPDEHLEDLREYEITIYHQKHVA